MSLLLLFNAQASAAPQPAGIRLYAANSVPGPALTDASAYTSGLKFRVLVAGTITGMLYYRGDAAMNNPTGAIWTLAGTKLADVAFPASPPLGWVEAAVNPPLAVASNTLYVAGAFFGAGRSSSDDNRYATAVTNGNLVGVATSESPNNVYDYGAALVFPTLSGNGANDGLDVRFLAGVRKVAPQWLWID